MVKEAELARTEHAAGTLSKEAADAARELLESLKSAGLADIQSDRSIEKLQDRMNALCEQLIYAFTEPLVDRVEPFLVHLRKAGSILVGEKDLQRDPSYSLGQLHAIAQVAEMVRHQKVPRRAAEVLVNHKDAQSIARIVFERGSIGLSQLAAELQKKSQNLRPVLEDMQTAQLLRRDELGRNVVFSPTPLTRAAVQWDGTDQQRQRSVEAA
jgi:hypothetical protein